LFKTEFATVSDCLKSFDTLPGVENEEPRDKDFEVHGDEELNPEVHGEEGLNPEVHGEEGLTPEVNDVKGLNVVVVLNIEAHGLEGLTAVTVMADLVF